MIRVISVCLQKLSQHRLVSAKSRKSPKIFSASQLITMRDGHSMRTTCFLIMKVALFILSISFISVDQIVELNPTPTWSEASVATEDYKVNSLIRVKDKTTTLIEPFYIPSSKFGRSCMGTMVGYKRNEEQKCMTKNTSSNCENKMGHQFYDNIEFDNSGGTTFIAPTISCINSLGNPEPCQDSVLVLAILQNSLQTFSYSVW